MIDKGPNKIKNINERKVIKNLKNTKKIPLMVRARGISNSKIR